MKPEEFQEIAHTGGTVTFTITTDDQGRRSYQIACTHANPHPSALFAVWALPQGAALAGIHLRGMGVPWNPPPVPDRIPVFISSDSQGKFGRQCPSCGGYWRSATALVICPYCATGGERHRFLTDAQRRYVLQYCQRLREALGDEKDGDHVIDMDAVARAAGQDVEKPPFYYAEESQQNQFSCYACGAYNDILGKFCYCSTCGTRNDLHELQSSSLPKIRDRINSSQDYEACLCNAVSAFDTFVGQYTKQLLRRIPLRSARKARLERMRFHNLRTTAAELKAAFDIDILEDMSPEDIAYATLIFHRRHVYEHHGGQVDEKYLADSGDTVRLGQEIRETQHSAHRLASLVEKMAKAFHSGFHDIFPPRIEPIEQHQQEKKRREKRPAKS